MDPLDLLPDLVITLRTCWTPAGIGTTRGVFMVGGWGDCQFPADRLDTQILAMDVDERHHHLPGRSSSAIAKYADALRKISLARRSSFTSRYRNLRRSRSSAASAAGPARRLASSRHHRRSASSAQPIFAAIDFITSHSETGIGHVGTPVPNAHLVF